MQLLRQRAFILFIFLSPLQLWLGFAYSLQTVSTVLYGFIALHSGELKSKRIWPGEHEGPRKEKKEGKRERGKRGKRGKRRKNGERNETLYGRNLSSYLVQLPLPPSILLFLCCCCYNSDKARQSLLASTVASFNSSCQTLLGHAVAPAHYILLARGQRNIGQTAAASPESAGKYHRCQRVEKEKEKNLRCTEPRPVRPRIRKPELK